MSLGTTGLTVKLSVNPKANYQNGDSVFGRYGVDQHRHFARRWACLGESYTDPERIYRLCRARGMRFVTISDHNMLAGALRITHQPDTFLSVEWTMRFPGDDVPSMSSSGT